LLEVEINLPKEFLLVPITSEVGSRFFCVEELVLHFLEVGMKEVG
jgi:hypothetical protein